MIDFRSTYAMGSIALLLSWQAISPASAYKWPGREPSIGGALAAKSIGRHCKGALTPSEIAELDTFLAKAGKEWTANPKLGTSFDKVVHDLSQIYDSRYANAKECNGDATEEARDSLGRVQKALASGKPVLADRSDPNRRPDPYEVVVAKVVAEKCAAAFTAREWADLEFDLASYLRAAAKIPNEGDARATLEVLKTVEANFTAAWTKKDCDNPSTVGDAKAVVARIRKATAPGR